METEEDKNPMKAKQRKAKRLVRVVYDKSTVLGTEKVKAHTRVVNGKIVKVRSHYGL